MVSSINPGMIRAAFQSAGAAPGPAMAPGGFMNRVPMPAPMPPAIQTPMPAVYSPGMSAQAPQTSIPGMPKYNDFANQLAQSKMLRGC